MNCMMGWHRSPLAPISICKPLPAIIARTRPEPAGTTHAHLALGCHEGTIRLAVQDWGCGFEPRAQLETIPGEHMGLREMRERVELIGGHFSIDSQPGAGTLVLAEVPLPSSKEGDNFNEH